jgi:two-component sensor histidine kinase
METMLRLLPPRPGSYLVRYALATVLVAICAGLVMQLHRETGAYGFFIFYLAIFLSSVLFDHNSGFWATALSVVFMYFRLRTPGMSLLEESSTPLLALFAVISVGVAFVSEGLRKAWERAVEAERVSDLLLQELRHRTKNDLAMVISVLALQARGKVSEETKSALQHAMSRIRAISGAHDHFAPLDEKGRVNIKAYLTDLCSHFNESLRDIRPIAVEVDIDEASLQANDAQPIGLIVNELVTNALKHAFPDERVGVVRVTMRNGPPRVLTVEDNGVGFESIESGGIGSRLTGLLVKQLGGTITWEPANPGCRVRVVLGEE